MTAPQSSRRAREFKHRVKAGMVGIDVGVPATMAMFPFTGWNDSFYGDLHIQGRERVQFLRSKKSSPRGGLGTAWGPRGKNEQIDG
jgi:malonate-semialdehyde dehydrogenase (acetylating)/methylmalonate-semialdehyde dehydrogenase